MDIKKATEQIEGSARAYLSKDVNGLYRIPFEMQRPLILMGPPGVGKTAIVAQVAETLGINFVSYSITHHTRQSALGLPYIAEASFMGENYKVSRYTMSEIIASVYDAIETTGIKEGILFLDEINCASETLAPAMLQFLQYKRFGQHALPEGWVIVSAGNPPEYNKSAREFDSAMMDRMKRIDIAPDVNVWMDYASTHGVHPAILTYLTNKPENFYSVRARLGGSSMVTARGWEDLSRMIQAYEHEGLEIDLPLISQYIQHPQIAEDFALYYDLFNKYKDDYKIPEILDGTSDETISERAQKAPFGEKVALVNLLTSTVLSEVHEISIKKKAYAEIRNLLVEHKDAIDAANDLAVYVAELESEQETKFNHLNSLGAVSRDKLAVVKQVIGMFEAIRKHCLETVVVQQAGELTSNFEICKVPFNEACYKLAEQTTEVVRHVDNVLTFTEDTFGDGQELVVLISKLSCDSVFMRFVAQDNLPRFVELSEKLHFSERGLSLLDEIKALDDAIELN